MSESNDPMSGTGKGRRHIAQFRPGVHVPVPRGWEPAQPAQDPESIEAYVPPPRRRIVQKKSSPMPWVISAVVLLVGAGIGIFFAGQQSQKSSTTAPLAAPGSSPAIEPGFDVAIQRYAGGSDAQPTLLRWVAVTNKGSDALEVSDVSINGEFRAIPASANEKGTFARPDPSLRWPRTAAPGEHLFFLVYQASAPDKSYEKEIHFIHFRTSRGNLRYTFGFGFSKE